MFILASKSPRRKQLMKEDISSDFSVIVKEVDEKKSYVMKPIDAVMDIAKRKGEVVANEHPNDIVISADTIVVFNDEKIGKPKDQNDAFNMLKKLSNNKHLVITGYAIFYHGNMHVSHSISYVYFNDLSDKLINDYIASGSPMDKAGSYGIQDEEFPIVKKYEGSYKNIMGFPVEDIKKDLIELGLL